MIVAVSLQSKTKNGCNFQRFSCEVKSVSIKKTFCTMAIEYVKVKRTITVGRNPGEKFQARIKRGQTIDEKDLCDEITESTTLARGEVKLVVEQLQYHIVKHAKNGESVQLKELGIFYPSISAKAVDSVDDVTSETITRKCIRYRQNVEVRKAMDNSHTKLANMEIKGLQS